MESDVNSKNPKSKNGLDLRKKLLINPDFQKKFVMNMIAINAVISAVNFAAQSYFFWNARQMGLKAGVALDHVYFTFLAEQQRSLTAISLGTFAVASAIIIAFGLTYSHRIAGPVYRIQIYLKNRLSGVEDRAVNLRDGDYFGELADSVNDYVLEKEKPSKKVA